MSPELVKAKPVDARTDLFSLGCTMYRLLTGEYAYPGLTREDRLVKRIRERAVPIKDVRPELPARLARIVDRLLSSRPDDRHATAAELAEDLEALLPPASRTGRRGGDRQGSAAPGSAPSPVHSEPDAPPDWSLIESALNPGGHETRRSSRLVDRQKSRPPSSKGLSSHRKSLEEDGTESGREAHQKYRNQLVQMNRVMAELRSMDSDDDSSAPEQTWLVRIGERIGDQLAEPSAGLILVGILVVLLVLAFALAMAIG
jgi:serine/threonine protein kinase